ncbi:hypothetical protein H0A36_10110 [Endozoicomonas sp. SM1973]|uniref:Uncharacterized protein n=1 Tax=Spartinivicinus marinus TaxID=2994442 RepID=A0A853IAU7_9GAMM|nr:hypothetical protein [Spartinivicinus marinus]MCX4027463.1 hypothetical protein [Spartinivicinus marinus]NYZ66365.1 hypothetical protein [Spartinivicinus marinus]
MNKRSVSLCHNGCNNSETEMALLLIKKHELFLKKNYPTRISKSQQGFFQWAWFTVLEAMLLASFYNLPNDNFEELLLFIIESHTSHANATTQQVELESFA